MKFFAICLFVLAIFAYARGDDVTCSDSGKILKVGESHQPAGECHVVKCLGSEFMSLATCEDLKTEGNDCKVIDEDVTKPYPECCPHLDC